MKWMICVLLIIQTTLVQAFHHCLNHQAFIWQPQLLPQPGRLLSSPDTVQDELDNTNESISSPGCPFSKAFPKYRIDLTRFTKDSNKTPKFSLPFVSDVQKSMEKSKLERQYTDVRWLEVVNDNDTTTVSSDLYIFTKLWRAVADLSSAEDTSSSLVVAVADSSKLRVVRQWLDILHWIMNMIQEKKINCDQVCIIEGNIMEEGGVIIVELKRIGEESMPQQQQSSSASSTKTIDSNTLTQRTQVSLRKTGLGVEASL